MVNTASVIQMSAVKVLAEDSSSLCYLQYNFRINQVPGDCFAY